MKNYLLLFMFSIYSFVIFAQAPKYQTYTADLLIIATKNGDNIQWENKDIVVTLSYKTGDLKVIINNSDFYNTQTYSRVKEDDILDNSEFIFSGNLPIDQINNQKTTNQSYNTELQLINNDMSLSEEINFKMDIMRPNLNNENYMVFTLSGVLYNNELNLPAFRGYDNEVELRLIFNVFWTGS